MADEIIAARVRELLNYDPNTGVFTRRVRTAQRHQVGDRADFLITGGGQEGYYRVSFDGARYMAHRVAWLYVHGAWPTFDIDHLNGVRGDNRISNLRDVPNRVNRQNIRGPRIDNRVTGVLGVTIHQGRYRSRVQINGKAVEVGSFDTLDAARDAYLSAKRRLHEGCTI